MTNTSVENLPWWAILLILVGILVLVMLIIPLVRFLINKKHEIQDNKIKPLERKVISTKPTKDPKNTPYMGFNWFGKKQAIRTVKTVYVQEVEDPCPLCAPFENKVLSLEEYGTNVTLMSEAISVGYHHLGCKHVDLDYFHETTEIPKMHWSNSHKKQRYALRLQQYQFEEKIRNLKYQIDNEVKEPKEQKQLINQMNFIKEQLIEFCEQNNLERNELRENYTVSELEKFS